MPSAASGTTIWSARRRPGRPTPSCRCTDGLGSPIRPNPAASVLYRDGATACGIIRVPRSGTGGLVGEVGSRLACRTAPGVGYWADARARARSRHRRSRPPSPGHGTGGVHHRAERRSARHGSPVVLDGRVRQAESVGCRLHSDGSVERARHDIVMEPSARIPCTVLEVRQDDEREVASGIVADDRADARVDALLLEEQD